VLPDLPLNDELQFFPEFHSLGFWGLFLAVQTKRTAMNTSIEMGMSHIRKI
jgi:hypothetical protein